MEQFFRSVGGAFGANRESAPLGLAVLVALLLLVLALQAVRLWRDHRARRWSLLQYGLQRGLTEADVRRAGLLAAQAVVDLQALLTRIDVFEQVTARALSGRLGPPGAPEHQPAFLRKLRQALGFDRLPAHFPLLTTRELARGTAVQVAGQPGQVAAVDEVTFALELAHPVELLSGATAELSLDHAREARYSLRCRVLALQPAGDGRLRLLLEHDEAPHRLQRREHARVPARGRVALRLHRHLYGAAAAEEAVGELVDVSAGGLQIRCAAPLPAGLLAEATFELGPHRFAFLQAVVLSSHPVPGGAHHCALEFYALAEPERERLAASVARLGAHAAQALAGR